MEPADRPVADTNCGKTGVLSALQYTAAFPKVILGSFYQESRNSIDAARKDAAAGYVIPTGRDMTRVAQPRRRAIERASDARGHVFLQRADRAIDLVVCVVEVR